MSEFEQNAKECVRSIHASGGFVDGVDSQDLIELAIEAAVLAEREACAKIAESLIADQVAAFIRFRGA